MRFLFDRPQSFRPQLERIEDRVLPGEAFGLASALPMHLLPEDPGLASTSREENHPASAVLGTSPRVDWHSAWDPIANSDTGNPVLLQSQEAAPISSPAAAFDTDALVQMLRTSNDFHPAGLVLDQSNIVPNFQFDAAVISAQSVAQTFTVGVDGTLAQVDLQIYKNSGTTGDVVLDIRPTINGSPDPYNGNILYETVIPLDSMPTIDDPRQDVPLTSIDVSAGKLAVAQGDMLALSLSREGQGSPPWVAWRQGEPIYKGGSGYFRSDSTSDWRLLGHDGGFQTWVIPS
jgi:hypothetical protein